MTGFIILFSALAYVFIAMVVYHVAFNRYKKNHEALYDNTEYSPDIEEGVIAAFWPITIAVLLFGQAFKLVILMFKGPNRVAKRVAAWLA